jgi:Ala-tRNA(Pro) deacylase
MKKDKISSYLKSLKIKFREIPHKTVYTAFDKAKTLRMPLKNIGKNLIMKIDKELALVLVPANKNLDLGKLKKTINEWRKKTNQKAIKNISFIKEALIKKNLPGVKVGTIPPFGDLWKLPSFIDKSLTKAKEIIVSAGDYNISLGIKKADLKKLNFIAGNFSKTKK